MNDQTLFFFGWHVVGQGRVISKLLDFFENLSYMPKTAQTYKYEFTI